VHAAAGAVLTPPERGGTLLTYGDVPGEYRAGVEACLLFDATTRGALAVRGGDAESFLHRILANTIKGLAPGDGNRNLLLSAKGKVLHDFGLTREEAGFFLSTPAGHADDLRGALDVFLFADAVEFEELTESHAPLELCGPTSDAVARAVLEGELPDAPHRRATLAHGGAPVTVERLPIAGSPGLRLDAGPDHAHALWSALVAAGARPAGLVARDSLRVEACRARWGQDVDDGIYPQEARLDDAFSLDKGCYIGQEVVAKIDTYGGLNKCLFPLRIDHDDPVAAGTRLMREEHGEWRDLGVVTSWAYSFALDTGLVLGYVKRKHQAPGTVFRLGDGASTATLLEPPVRAGVTSAG
jgi:folate-binding protein YgfZ